MTLIFVFFLLQVFTPQLTTVTFTQDAQQQLQAHVTSQSLDKSGNPLYVYDRALTGQEATAVLAGDLSFPTAAVSKDANAQWVAQATAAQAASQPPAPPVVLSTAKGDPAQADAAISDYTAKVAAIQSGVQALLQQTSTKLPIATQLDLLQQIQSLVQEALAK